MPGQCPVCRGHFEFRLIDNQADRSSYAYCALCGILALCSREGWPARVGRIEPGPLEPEQIAWLRRCECGGWFHTHGVPRCPSCRGPLDPIDAAPWIERRAAETARDWRWQRSWRGAYALSVGERVARDPWAAG